MIYNIIIYRSQYFTFTTFTLLHRKHLKSRTYLNSVESILPFLLIKGDVENMLCTYQGYLLKSLHTVT